MNKTIIKMILTMIIIGFVSNANATIDPFPIPEPSIYPISVQYPGIMVGSGIVANQFNNQPVDPVVHKFTLNCDVNSTDNSLIVIWENGNKQFNLTELSSTQCNNDPELRISPTSGFNTFQGNGMGTMNKNAGYTISWTFTDAINPIQLSPLIPMRSDEASITIYDPLGVKILESSGSILKGSHKAMDL